MATLSRGMEPLLQGGGHVTAVERGARPPLAAALPGSASGGDAATRTLLVDVIVPVLDKHRFLTPSLTSILDDAERSGVARVTVLDHGSTDGSLDLGAALCRGRARHLVRPGGSVAALRNVGAGESDRDVLCFIDSDCVVPPGYFDALVRVMARSEVGATGRRVDYPVDGSWIERTWHALHCSRADGFRHYLNSGNFAVRREIFERVGGFDPSLATGEDSELGMRLGAAGHLIWESASLSVVHLDNPRTLRAFFRKEVWHAEGMLPTLRVWPPHLPALSALVHLLCLISAVGLLLAGQAPWGWRLMAALALSVAMPTLAVAYRVLPAGRRVPWLPAIALYQVYLVARVRGFASSIGRSLRQRWWPGPPSPAPGAARGASSTDRAK